ncbi:MAG: cation-transporting P-type ATPase [Phyllobacteriaceae bacterium]|nr:cation-transporting P-type ATPase [Phyllobacteriaceae bacterium]
MRIQRLDVAEALRGVGSSATGLSSAEAAARLAAHGPNRIEKAARRPWPIRLAGEFVGLFSIILWIAAGLAAVAEGFDPGHGMARVAIAVVLVILVSGLFSFWQEHGAERALEALQRLLPRRARVLRDGELVEVPVETLVVGDVIDVEQGDDVPADCRVLEAVRLRIDTSVVTGESASRPVDANVSTADDPPRATNLLLAGMSVVSGRGRAVIFAIGAETEFGRIARLTQGAGAATSPLRDQLASLSRTIGAAAVAVGALFFALGAAIGVPIWQDLIFSIGLIVAMVPEGLLPTLTLALVLSAKRLAARGVLIRDLTSIETLGFATVVCTDKTGTLTENRMRARSVLVGDALVALDDLVATPDLCRRHDGLFRTALLCHDVEILMRDGEPTFSGDPTEIALVEMARAVVGPPDGAAVLDELPFDSERKRQSVIVAESDGRLLLCKGALEGLLDRCVAHRSDDGVEPLDEGGRARIRRTEAEMATSGLRVLAFATRRLPPDVPEAEYETDLTFEGLVGLEDPPRAEVPAAVARCRTAGIRVIMITGDHPLTAVAVARRIGLVSGAEPRVITGEELRRIGDVALSAILREETPIFARMVPEQKMRIVERLTADGHVVAVTGDGVNDAPALKAAAIGVAMGRVGTDVAKEAADMVLIDDDFASIVAAVEEGRAVFRNIRRVLTYVLVHNVAQLVPYLAFALFAVPLPITPIQILYVDMGTDSLTALGLGTEAARADGMRLPPHPRGARLLSREVALRAYAFLGPIEAVAALTAFFFVLLGGGWSWGAAIAETDPLYRQATTACLAAIVVLQIVNVFSCRSAVHSAFTRAAFANPLILAGVALEVALLVVAVATPLGHELLGTENLPVAAWVSLVPFAMATIAAEEVRKAIVRRRL